MQGSAIFTTALGLIFINALLSLVLSALNEWLMRLRARRGLLLKEQTARLLGVRIGEAYEKQPLIAGLRDNAKGDGYPSYMPPFIFASALLDIGYDFHTGTHTQPGQFTVKKRWGHIADQQLLESLRQDATNFGSLQVRIEKWFELSMERTSGRYKREVQTVLTVAALGVVLLGNVDTIAIARSLYDGAARNLPVSFAIGGKLSLAIFRLEKLAGLFLSWAAISLGAPFWFDVLNKVVNLRQTGIPSDQSVKGRAGGLIA